MEMLKLISDPNCADARSRLSCSMLSRREWQVFPLRRGSRDPVNRTQNARRVKTRPTSTSTWSKAGRRTLGPTTASEQHANSPRTASQSTQPHGATRNLRGGTERTMCTGTWLRAGPQTLMQIKAADLPVAWGASGAIRRAWLIRRPTLVQRSLMWEWPCFLVTGWSQTQVNVVCFVHLVTSGHVALKTR